MSRLETQYKRQCCLSYLYLCMLATITIMITSYTQLTGWEEGCCLIEKYVTDPPTYSPTRKYYQLYTVLYYFPCHKHHVLQNYTYKPEFDNEPVTRDLIVEHTRAYPINTTHDCIHDAAQHVLWPYEHKSYVSLRVALMVSSVILCGTCSIAFVSCLVCNCIRQRRIGRKQKDDYDIA